MTTPKTSTPFSDVFFLVILVTLLVNVLYGASLWHSLSSRPGVPDLLQGGMGILCLILLVWRSLSMKRRNAS